MTYEISDNRIDADDEKIEQLLGDGILVPVEPDYEAGYKAWHGWYLTAAGAGPWHPDMKDRLQREAFRAGVDAALKGDT